MARSQVADGGAASNMGCNCEYTEKSRGQQARGTGPSFWVLGEVLTTPPVKTGLVTKQINVPQA
jgi:hypothetical protein